MQISSFGVIGGNQSSEEMHLSAGNINKIIEILIGFIDSQNYKMLVSKVSQLKIDLNLNGSSTEQVRLVLFGFQDAVSVSSNSTEYVRRQVGS